MFDESFDAEPSTPRPIADPRRLELLDRADAHAERHVGGGAMADADARPAQPLDFARVEMNAVRDPGAGREPAGLFQKIDRTHAERRDAVRRPRRATGRDGSAAGNRSARRAPPILPSPASARRAASRARAPRGSSRRGSDRDRASARARCPRGSSPNPARSRPAAGRRPSRKCPSIRASTVMRRPSFVASSTSMSTAFSRPGGKRL